MPDTAPPTLHDIHVGEKFNLIFSVSYERQGKIVTMLGLFGFLSETTTTDIKEGRMLQFSVPVYIQDADFIRAALVRIDINS